MKCAGPRQIPKIFERGDPEPLKMTFDCFFQSFSNKSFVNIPPKGGGGLLNPPLVWVFDSNNAPHSPLFFLNTCTQHDDTDLDTKLL